jgi:DNA-binding NarL/FixJ family response regulator
MENKSIRVVVADEHIAVRHGLVQMLSRPGFDIVAIAECGKGVVDSAVEHKPDVIVMDMRLPKRMDGLSAVAKIRELCPDTKIVMFSANEDPSHVAQAITRGADEYLLKMASKEEVVQTVTRASQGTKPDETVLYGRIHKALYERKTVQCGDIRLTPREAQTLRHIALGLSNPEIGKSLGISVETVKEHVQHMLRKVGVRDRTRAAVWAVKNGLV